MDECKENIDNCDINLKCYNKVGNLKCNCKPEYEGNGMVCEC